MSSKHKVVLFLEDNARIITTQDPKKYENVPYCLIDPDLTAVKGHPPHYWRLVDGKVIPITNEEKIRRDAAYHSWAEKDQNDFIDRVRVAINEERSKYVDKIKDIQNKYMVAAAVTVLIVTFLVKLL